ncbi:phosphotransferase family protein [Streptomyces sp. NPDC001351]|uniref:phosphotransferase family protein n=1 Tax=Streptomyces sp. NPDC001351 TaxID=3364564 RepID=UPI003676302B
MRGCLAIAAQHGIHSSVPTVMHSRSNIVVHLRPAPVVARISLANAAVREDVDEWFAREVSVVRFLAEWGAPVIPLSDLLPPGPHKTGAAWVTFWTFVDHDPRRTPSPVTTASLLAELHEALRHYPGQLPYLPQALTELEANLSLLTRSPGPHSAFMPLLHHEFSALLPTIEKARGRARPLHGDAHPGNLLVSAAGPLWADFEDVAAGPAEWDVACVARRTPHMIRPILKAFGDELSEPDMRVYLRARALQRVVWIATSALYMPERRTRAAQELDVWRHHAADEL